MTDAPDPLVIFTPSGKRGRVSRGTSVLAAARALGVDLDSVCGGRGICSKCQIAPAFGDFPKHGVASRPEALSDWNAVEERYRSKRGMIEGRRLGCQAQILADLVIDVPPESQTHAQVVRKDLSDRAIVLDPAVRLHVVTVEEPDMHAPSGDLERLRDALATQAGIAGAALPHELLPRLQKTLRDGGWRVTLAVHHGDRPEILDLWPGAAERGVYGLAFDVGSTTIACHLCDLVSGQPLASSGAMNPQIRFGEDLMSRVSYAMMTEGGAEAMTGAVHEALDRLAGAVCDEAGVARDDVVDAVLVGNPVMHHLLLGVDPVELGGAPFALATAEAVALPASALGLSLHPRARAWLPPCIAGHVGADAAAVALAEAPDQADDLTLIVDVGTNAEILLGDREGGVLACSSPTGPAFEGAQISSGQRAAPGAIERIRIDADTKEPRYRVIGCDLWSDEDGFAEAAPRVTGLCGSGIIEAVAEMRLAGVTDEDGVIGSAEQTGSPRCRQDGRTFLYEIKPEDARGPRIAVTQNDVRAIQLAKAALYAGARLLMDERGVDAVDRVVLAGAFGAHISPLHAMALGMIPDAPLDAVRAAGNAAGEGARMALLNRPARAHIEALARRIRKVETAVEPRFQEHFVAAMALPHKTDPYPRLRAVAALPSVSHGRAEPSRRRRR